MTKTPDLTVADIDQYAEHYRKLRDGPETYAPELKAHYDKLLVICAAARAHVEQRRRPLANMPEDHFYPDVAPDTPTPETLVEQLHAAAQEASHPLSTLLANAAVRIRSQASLLAERDSEIERLKAQVDRFADGVLYEQKRNRDLNTEISRLTQALSQAGDNIELQETEQRGYARAEQEISRLRGEVEEANRKLGECSGGFETASKEVDALRQREAALVGALETMNAVTAHQTDRLFPPTDLGGGITFPIKFHPLTCGNDSNHTILFPYWDGEKVCLWCRDCGYTQDNSGPVSSSLITKEQE